jgi:hypothetical protein
LCRFQKEFKRYGPRASGPRRPMAACPASAHAHTQPCHDGLATIRHLLPTLTAGRPPLASRRPRAPCHPSLSLPRPVDEARLHFATSCPRSTLHHAPLLHTMPQQLPAMTTVPQATQGPPVSPISSPLCRCSVHEEIQPLRRAPRALHHLPHLPMCALRRQTLLAVPWPCQPSIEHQTDGEPLPNHFVGCHDPQRGPSLASS